MMQQTLTRIIRSKPFIVASASLFMYALLGFLLLPYLIERYIPVYAQEHLQRQASIGKVRVNPFLLTIELNDLRLRERDGQAIAGFQRLFVDFETSSLFRWAWTFADIRLTGLDVHFDIDSTGRSNFARLADSFPPSAEPAGEDQSQQSEAPVRMLLQHVRLDSGRLSFSDHTLATPASTKLEPINLEFEDLSTLPDRSGPYAIITTLPEGGKLVWRGEVSLRPIASDGELYLSGFKPSALWTFLQDRLRLAAPKGAVELYTHYRYTYSGGQSQLGLHGIQFNITGLDLRETDRQHSLVELDRFSARDGRFDLGEHELTFPKVALRNGQIAATLGQDGRLDWQQLVKPGKPDTTTTEASTPIDTETTPWNIRLESLQLENLGVQVHDLSRPQPLTLTIGRLGANTQLTTSIGVATALLADNLDVQLRDIALKQNERKEALVALDSFDLNGGRVDSHKRELDIQQVALGGATTDLSLDAQGRLNLQQALSTTHTESTADGAIPRQKTQSAETAWQLRLAQLQAKDFHLGFTDQRYQPALRYDLEKLSATLEHLSNSATQAASFDASVQVKQGGALTATGNFAPDGSRAEATIKADRISLKPLQSLIEHYTTLSLASGAVSTATQLTYAREQDVPALRVNGTANIDNLLINETDSGDRFLSWKTLTTNDLDFSLAPDHLNIKQLRVVQPGAKILVFKDRSLNLGKILKQPAEPNAPGTPAQVTDATKTAAADKAFPVSVERIRIEKGDVDFADMSLVLPFAAQIANLGGSITGISSSPSSRANIKLEGRVDKYGSVQVDGGLSPFAPKQYTDIHTRFRNIDMTPLSPYTATFAGRKVASGKLSLDLEYKVKDSQLAGDNKVLLDHFTLGENIESPDALDLPLDLAIGLLTDSQGRINVAVPVSGNVDSPTFSYGKLVGQAIVGMLGKIITAPFRALGSLLGGGSEDLDSVAFDAGSARLQPPQIETLKKVGQALQERPQLDLSVSGRYDAQLDGMALRTEHVRRELAKAVDSKFDPDEEPPAAAVDQAKTQRALEKLLEARAGDKAVDNFKSAFEKTAGRSAEPVNPALALFGKASPDVDFYQAMFERLVELHPLEDSELQALAQRRAQAIIETLVTQAGLNRDRVTPGKIETTQGSEDNGVDSKLLLATGARDKSGDGSDKGIGTGTETGNATTSPEHPAATTDTPAREPTP